MQRSIQLRCLAEVDKIHQIVKTGYISKNNYRDKFQFDQKVGVKERQRILDMLELVLRRLDHNVLNYKINKRGSNITLEMELNKRVMKINFDTINSIVSKNKDRKINKKQFLPFDKDMDKYNSIYVSVETDSIDEDTYIKIDRILEKIMERLNSVEDSFYFKSMVITNPLVV